METNITPAMLARFTAPRTFALAMAGRADAIELVNRGSRSQRIAAHGWNFANVIKGGR